MCKFMMSGGFDGMRSVISEAVKGGDDGCPHCAKVGLYPVNEAEIADDAW